MNLANKLTLMRIALIPLMILMYYLEIPFHFYLACAVFILACVTDAFDGAVARKYNQVTRFGKLIDPMADKLLICSAVIMLTASGYIHPVLTIVLIGREFVISAFRVVAAAEGIVLAADIYGKLKTVAQSIAVGFLLAGCEGVQLFVTIGTVAVWISAALSVWSCINYMIKNREVFREAGKGEA